MIVFEIHCNFFIVLPNRLIGQYFFLCSKAECARPKNLVRLRDFARPVGIGCAICPGLYAHPFPQNPPIKDFFKTLYQAD